MELSLMPYDAAQAMIERDHLRLEHLLGQMAMVCREQASPPRDCSECPQGRLAACRMGFGDIESRLMTYMLEHFEHEDLLMDLLPCDFAMAAHSVNHRHQHVTFAERLRQVTYGLDPLDIPGNAMKVESFVTTWIRRHALEYDAILAQLLRRATDPGAWSGAYPKPTHQQEY